MQIPIPTDNLYKFYCLFGLSIVLVFVSIVVIQYRAVNEEIHNANITAANSYVEISRLEIFLESNDSFISDAVLKEDIRPKSIIIPGRYPDKLLEIVFYVPNKEVSDQTKLLIEKINDVLEKQAFGHVKAKFALEKAKKLTSDLNMLFLISLAFIFFGLYQYLHGMRLWHERTQKPLDKKAKRKNDA